MESLRDLFIRLGLSVDAASFAEGLAFEHALEKAAELVVEAVEKIGEAFVEAIASTAEYGEQMVLLSQKTAVGVEEIQRLSYAAGLSGSSAGDLQVGLTHLARTMEEAKGGNEQARKSFTDLGLSMADVRGKSPDQVLLKMADRMKALGPSTKRTTGALELLGRGGSSLIPMLSDGAEGIKKLGLEADAAGVIMSAEAAKAAQDFGDNVKRLHQDLEGIIHQFAGPLIEALDPVVKAMHAWFLANRAMIGQRVEAFARGVVTAVRALASGVQVLVEHWGVVLSVLTGVIGALLIANAEFVALGIVAVASAAPFVLIAAVIAAAVLVAQDLWTFLRGGDSVIGSMLNKFTAFLKEWLTANDNWWVIASLKEALKWADRLVAVIESMDPTGILARLGNRANQFGVSAGGGHQTGTMEDAQRAIAQFQGNLGNPGQDAAASVAATPRGASVFQAPIQIVQKDGESQGDLADRVTGALEEFWDSKMREASPVAGQ